jgi:hypothetical protein
MNYKSTMPHPDKKKGGKKIQPELQIRRRKEIRSCKVLRRNIKEAQQNAE